MIYIPDDTLERLTAKTASIGDVDCLMLKTASLEKLAKSKLVGKIEGEDIDLIVGTVISSPKEKRIRLKRFGLV